VVPLRADQKALDRQAIERLREDYDVAQGRFSPDGRFLAYLSNEADPEKMQVYVRPFDATKPEAPPPGSAVRVSKKGALGMIFWRQDAKEMYFMIHLCHAGNAWPRAVDRRSFRHALGGVPTAFLNARLNAASDS
jgi:hypothetical protein